jgi:glycosyltransferase involved in cell wall biosynthesis
MPQLLLMGQTPPPWHGQAVATQILFDHDWAGFDVERLRMDFSSEMNEVGRFQLKKILTLFKLIFKARRVLSRNPESILFYPPASANWVPFLRDVIFLTCVRHMAARTVFIFHASGLAQFTQANWITRILAKIAYHNADVVLEVAEEKIAPNQVFGAEAHQWCPCGIDAPEMPPIPRRSPDSPLQVLFVGSLQEGKGILEILKTAAQLKTAGHGDAFHFQLVGRWMDNAFELEAIKLHRELQLENIISFVGQLTGDEKWRAYHNADVFFFPTHYPTEASPIVLMEALAAGLPIISTHWNGIPALMNGCPTATLLPIHSPGLYTQYFISHQQMRTDREVIARQSRDFYEAHFTPEQFIKRVDNALRLVIRNMQRTWQKVPCGG